MKHLIAAVFVVCLAAAASAQEPGMTAKLVDAEKKALSRSATVELNVTGIKIVDPASSKEMPKKGQGHFHYQVDNGPVIATTSAKLSFHMLTSGKHTIKVMLAGNDHAMLGPSQVLDVNIP